MNSPQPIDEANPLYEQIEKLFDLRINNTGNEIHISFGAKGVWVEYERFSKLRDSIEQLCRLNAAQAVTAALKRIPEPTMADVFPTNPARNPDSYDDMLKVVRWYKQAITNEMKQWQ